MMKQLQRLGRSLMLPVAALPVAAIMMGIGYWIDPTGWGANNIVAAFLLKSGGAIIDNMAWLFAVGVAIGMSDDKEGTSALAGLISFLVITTVLSSGAVALYTGKEADAAFGKISTQFTGILAGVIGAWAYNRFKNTNLPTALSFFSGRRSVAIVTAFVTLLICVPLFFIWPIIYNALVSFGRGIISLGPVGAGIYGFFNRLLIPVGLHHALNSVFWFDVAGIADIFRFWGQNLDKLPALDSVVTGIASVKSAAAGGEGISTVGIYMTGFFPVMMFGLPAAALAMYHTAKDEKKKVAFGLLSAAALSSFFTGVTEPMEFAFMFLAPALYVLHAILTGISLIITALLPVRAGFQFSAGFVDWFLSFKAPGAMNGLYLIPIGLAVGVIYYFLFRLFIKKFDLKTPGREDDIAEDEGIVFEEGTNFTVMAEKILEGLGGKENIDSLDHCITRLRVEVKDNLLVDEAKIKRANIAGIIRPSKKSVQVIVGPQVQFVHDEMKKMV